MDLRPWNRKLMELVAGNTWAQFHPHKKGTAPKHEGGVIEPSVQLEGVCILTTQLQHTIVLNHGFSQKNSRAAKTYGGHAPPGKDTTEQHKIIFRVCSQSFC